MCIIHPRVAAANLSAGNADALSTIILGHALLTSVTMMLTHKVSASLMLPLSWPISMILEHVAIRNPFIISWNQPNL